MTVHNVAGGPFKNKELGADLAGKIGSGGPD